MSQLSSGLVACFRGSDAGDLHGWAMPAALHQQSPSGKSQSLAERHLAGRCPSRGRSRRSGGRCVLAIHTGWYPLRKNTQTFIVHFGSIAASSVRGVLEARIRVWVALSSRFDVAVLFS